MRRTRIFSIIILLLALVSSEIFQLKNNKKADETPPQIMMDSDLVQISVSDGESGMLKGITATDDVDGDVTDSLFVETVSNFMDDHIRSITVCAVDQSGNVSRATREVQYTDYTSPVFSLSAPLRFSLSTTDIMSDIGAEDLLDGDISDHVKIAGAETLTDEPGDYPMEFSVTNSAGDVVYLDATVTLYDYAEEYKNPTIELTDYLIYTKVGEEVYVRKYLKSLTGHNGEYQNGHDGYFHQQNQGEEDSLIAVARVNVTDNVDYSTPGTYEVLFEYTDPYYTNETRTGSVRLIIIVQE